MPTVTHLESRLLRILRFLVGSASRQSVWGDISKGGQRPAGLSNDCLGLVKETLSKGVVRFLASQQPSWQKQRFLREGEVVDGRLWQRTKPDQLGLAFSANTMDFLLSLTCAGVGGAGKWRPRHKLTSGDRLLLFMAYRAARKTRLGPGWQRNATFYGEPLCVLCFSADFADASDQPGSCDWDPWVSSAMGQAVLEALQSEIAQGCLQLERQKWRVESGDRIRLLGTVQRRAVTSYLEAVDRQGRRDLARWMFLVWNRLRLSDRTAATWTGQLQLDNLPVRDRIAVRESALALPLLYGFLSEWQEDATRVGYFEEGYAAAQHWKADWESYNGDAIIAKVQEIRDDPEFGLAGWQS